MPGPQHKLLQLGHDNAVVNLVPTIHNQVASHGIHGIELAAGVGGTQHRLVVGAGSNRMCEAGNGRIARARSVNGGDIGVFARNARPLWKPTEPAAPMDTTTQGISEKRASEASAERSSSTSSVVKLVPRRPLISVRLGLTSSGLTSDLSAASSEGARGIEQHLGAGVLCNARDLWRSSPPSTPRGSEPDMVTTSALPASSANLAVKASSSSGASSGRSRATRSGCQHEGC